MHTVQVTISDYVRVYTHDYHPPSLPSHIPPSLPITSIPPHHSSFPFSPSPLPPPHHPPSLPITLPIILSPSPYPHTPVQHAMMLEFQATRDQNSLMRANTAITRMMTTYTRRGPGMKYVKLVLGELIQEVAQLNSTMEINPLQVREGRGCVEALREGEGCVEAMRRGGAVLRP